MCQVYCSQPRGGTQHLHGWAAAGDIGGQRGKVRGGQPPLHWGEGGGAESPAPRALTRSGPGLHRFTLWAPDTPTFSVSSFPHLLG